MRVRAAAVSSGTVHRLDGAPQGRAPLLCLSGGGVDDGETPEGAVIREVFEELGLAVRVLRPIAEVWLDGSRRFITLLRKWEASWKGQGSENGPDRAALHGTYEPVGCVLTIFHYLVLPHAVAELVVRSSLSGWPKGSWFCMKPTLACCPRLLPSRLAGSKISAGAAAATAWTGDEHPHHSQAFASLEEPAVPALRVRRLLVASGHRVTMWPPVSYLTGRRTSASRLALGAGPRRPDHLRIRRAGPMANTTVPSGTASRLSSLHGVVFPGQQTAGPVDVVWGHIAADLPGLTGWLVAVSRARPPFRSERSLASIRDRIGVLRGGSRSLSQSAWSGSLLSRRRRVANSPGFVDHILKRGGRQVRLILNGADPSMFDPAADGADLPKEAWAGRASHCDVCRCPWCLKRSQCAPRRSEVARRKATCTCSARDGKEKPASVRGPGERLANVTFLDPVRV